MKIPFSSRTYEPMPIARKKDKKGDLKKKNINLWNTSQWLLMQKKKHKKTKTKHKKTKNKTNKKTKKSKIVKNSKATL